MTTAARLERLALCDLFDQVGPDAPTLCGEWTTRDLAAHLVIRERRPDAALGIVAKPFADHGESVRAREALQPFADIVAKVRKGPPIWSPTRLAPIDKLANTVEFFVHHEDVRRGGDSWEPRSLSPELDEELLGALGRMAKMMARRSPCGLVLEPSGGSRTVAKAGEPSVVLRGSAGELVLFLFGRQDKSRVTVVGPEELVEAVRSAPFGI